VGWGLLMGLLGGLLMGLLGGLLMGLLGGLLMGLLGGLLMGLLGSLLSAGKRNEHVNSWGLGGLASSRALRAQPSGEWGAKQKGEREERRGDSTDSGLGVGSGVSKGEGKTRR